MPFSFLGLSAPLIKAIAEQGYTTLYPIQKEAIPAILDGKDILGIAQTGSGKTASFVLPILEKIQDQSTPTRNRHIRALVLVPTRELAIQINSAFNVFGNYLLSKVKCLAVHGGVSINPQMIELQGVEILVATPGRLLELISSKALSLSDVQVLVLDEADKMLNLGFKEEMTQIFDLLPSKRQTLLFSATLSNDVDSINKNLLREPIVIKVDDEIANLDLIEQTAYKITEERKGPLLRYIIIGNDLEQVLVFTSTVHRADMVADKLNKNGIKAASIHSKKSQGTRTAALSLFKAGKIRVLVATDLMARGIDIKFLPCVINYELPRSPKDYVHRIGRTGRAESRGKAISFITPEDEHHFKVIQKKMGKMATFVDGNDIDLSSF
ncbi:MAG TPA: RNA helicase [Bacteroidales bacterium]|nr:RNA helicase [Bacteroidales bacterium]